MSVRRRRNRRGRRCRTCVGAEVEEAAAAAVKDGWLRRRDGGGGEGVMATDSERWRRRRRGGGYAEVGEVTVAAKEWWLSRRRGRGDGGYKGGVVVDAGEIVGQKIRRENGGQKWCGYFVEHMAGAQNAGRKRDQKDAPVYC